MTHNKKVNLLEVLLEQAEREAKAVKSGMVYEPYIYPKDEETIIVIDKAHVLKRLETLTDIEPLYFHEYAIKSDERIVHRSMKVNRSDPNREAMDTLNAIVINFLARKKFKPYKRSAVWVRAPKGKRVLRVELKRRGS